MITYPEGQGWTAVKQRNAERGKSNFNPVGDGRAVDREPQGRQLTWVLMDG